MVICLLTLSQPLSKVADMRTNVLRGEEKFDKGEVEDKVSQELLQYLKQQNLMVAPVILEMQRLQNNMDNLLYGADLPDYDKIRQYMQLQNRFLTYKHQLNLLPETTMRGGGGGGGGE